MQDKFWVNPDKPLSPASTPTVPKVTPGRVLGLYLPFLPSRALLCWSQPPTSGGLTPCCAGGGWGAAGLASTGAGGPLSSGHLCSDSHGVSMMAKRGLRQARDGWTGLSEDSAV